MPSWYMESLSDDEKYDLGMSAVNVFIKAGEYLNKYEIIPIYSIKTVLNEHGLMDNYTACPYLINSTSPSVC